MSAGLAPKVACWRKRAAALALVFEAEGSEVQSGAGAGGVNTAQVPSVTSS